MKNQECCICLKKLERETFILNCEHIIHEKCLKLLIDSECPSKNKCPICRKDFNIDRNNKYLYRERENIEDDISGIGIIGNNTLSNNIPLPIAQLFLFMRPF